VSSGRKKKKRKKEKEKKKKESGVSKLENRKVMRKEEGQELALPKGRARLISPLKGGKSKHTMNWRSRIHRLRAKARPTAQHSQRLRHPSLSCPKQSSVCRVKLAFSPCWQGSSADVLLFASATLRLLSRFALWSQGAWPHLASLPRPFHSTTPAPSASLFIDRLSVGSVD